MNALVHRTAIFHTIHRKRRTCCFHVLVLDGTYEHKSTGRTKFYPAKAPTEGTTKALAEDISTRINNHLVKKGYLEKQEDLMLLGNTEDIFARTNDSLHLPAQAAIVAHQIAFGPNSGKPVQRLKLGGRLLCAGVKLNYLFCT